MYATYLRLDILVWDSERAVIRAARCKLALSARRDPALRGRESGSIATCCATIPMPSGL